MYKVNKKLKIVKQKKRKCWLLSYSRKQRKMEMVYQHSRKDEKGFRKKKGKIKNKSEEKGKKRK